MKHLQTKANFLRTDWIQYIPTEPLSTRPVVEILLSNERVVEPRGGEIPIVETHWVDNSDGGIGDVIDVRVSEGFRRNQKIERLSTKFNETAKSAFRPRTMWNGPL